MFKKHIKHILYCVPLIAISNLVNVWLIMVGCSMYEIQCMHIQMKSFPFFFCLMIVPCKLYPHKNFFCVFWTFLLFILCRWALLFFPRNWEVLIYIYLCYYFFLFWSVKMLFRVYNFFHTLGHFCTVISTF